MNEPGEALSPDTVARLLRRWNHQVDHLALAKDLPEHRFDLQTSPDQSFSATRLRSNLERFFLVFANLRSAGRKVHQLRSWQDPARTGAFCGVYIVAWLSPIGVFHALVLVLIAYILSPAFRTLLFPPLDANLLPPSPAPPSTTEEPDADGPEPLDPFRPTLTAEEQREMAARDFTDGMSELATLGSRVSEEGESETGGTDGDTDPEEATDPVTVELEVDEAKTGRGGKRQRFRRAKVTRVARVERVGLPIMRTSGKVADVWEKWANGLSPPAPFPADVARVRLARYLIPIPIAGILFSPGTIMSILSFLLGFAFFGQPLFGLVAEILDVRMPGWRERWRNRHTMLDSAPTDLQVTVRLLRDAEQAMAPLPPPPPLPRRSRSLMSAKLANPPESSPMDSLRPSSSSLDLRSMTNSPEPLDPEPSPAASTSSKVRRPFFTSRKSHLGDEGEDSAPGAFHRGWDKVAKKATDRVRVATTKFDFSERLRQRETRKDEASASNFFAHRGGVPGHLILVPPTITQKNGAAAVWTLSFVRVAAFSTSASASSTRSFTNLSIPIASITALKKISGLGWKGKMAYEFLVGADKATMGGIKISWKGPNGEAASEAFRTIPRRDELFNRLVGLASKQRFESL